MHVLILSKAPNLRTTFLEKDGILSNNSQQNAKFLQDIGRHRQHVGGGFRSLQPKREGPKLSFISPLEGDVVFSSKVVLDLQVQDVNGIVSTSTCAPFTFSVGTISPVTGEVLLLETGKSGTAVKFGHKTFVELELSGSDLQPSSGNTQSVVITANLQCLSSDTSLFSMVSFKIKHYLAGDMDDVVLLANELWDNDGSKLVSLENFEEVLLLAHWDEDYSWLVHQPFPAIIYEKKPPRNKQAGKHGVPFNAGNEASAYLKYIVDYYDDLPTRTIFLHSHRYTYHQEDALILLPILYDRLSKVKRAPENSYNNSSSDYCNLNNMVWIDPDGERLQIVTENWDWLGRYLGPRPSYFLDRCCAQMVVHRDRIRLQPKEFYNESLTRISFSKTKKEDYMWGLLFEWIWHYVFGQKAIHAASLKNIVQKNKAMEHAAVNYRSVCLKNV